MYLGPSGSEPSKCGHSHPTPTQKKKKKKDR